MNWDRIEGKWNEMKGVVRSKWAKLTDDDLQNLAGKKDRLVGAIQNRYGVLKDDAEKQVEEWLAKLETPKEPKEPKVAKDTKEARGERAATPRH